jgi:alkanesulfonate monooxygenase SsuD/methylene tetrahydromethanopterin reductase-like flavin-dependent oxidoreductase (luciferase family)
VCCGATPEELERRAAAIGRPLADLRENAVAGTPAEVVDRIGQFAKAGATDAIYLQVLDLHDLDHVELIAAEVMPQVS